MSVNASPLATIISSGLGHLFFFFLRKIKGAEGGITNLSEQKQNLALTAEYLSLGTPGFALLMNLVVESSIWTCSAGTCAENHSVHLPLSVTCTYVAKVMFLEYLRFSAGSWPFSHFLTQKVHWSLPQVRPSLQPHVVSVVAVHSFTRTRAPKHRKTTIKSCTITHLIFK